MDRIATKPSEAGATLAPRLISIDTAAELLGVSSRHIRNLAARGQLRSVNLGRRVLIPRAEIDRLVGEPASLGGPQ